jgi:hypothetical protein
MDIIHRTVFYLKHSVSGTGVCLYIQVETTELDPTELVSSRFGPEIETGSIYWAQLSRFHLKPETDSSLWNSVFKKKKDGTMDNFQNCNTYVLFLKRNPI